MEDATGIVGDWFHYKIKYYKDDQQPGHHFGDDNADSLEFDV